jgi:apolipoprotein N-acyltransferase
MFAFNAVTLYWTGGFTHGKDPYLMLAGTLLLVAHPLWFSVPFVLWAFVRKRAGEAAALLAFPFLWVALEYVHSVNQFAFPWLLLGNTQTYDLPMIQMASVTGVYGISFLVAATNALGYLAIARVRSRAWSPGSARLVAALAVIALIQLAPRFYGAAVLSTVVDDPHRSLRIGVVQPNIDPFEKWAGHEEPQMQELLSLSESVADSGVGLLVWPETATPFYLRSPANAWQLERVRALVERRGVPLLSGIPDIVYYRAGESAPAGSKTRTDGVRYDNYNASILLLPDRTTPPQRYAKSILVPFAEHVPYSEHLAALNAAQWNFGLGGWSVGRDTTIFRLPVSGGAEARFANFICYESVFPGYVAAFVRKGAQFLTVVTNDSWWGNTSGAYQHERYAVMRAVETRRWVVQCANGGISSFVAPDGRIVASTRLYERTGLVGSVMLRDDMTWYAEHGDWFAGMVSAGALLSVLASLAFATWKGTRS